MLRTVNGYAEGEMYDVEHAKAIRMVEVGLASLKLELPAPRQPVEAEPDVDVLGKAPKRAPKNRMIRRAVTKEA